MTAHEDKPPIIDVLEHYGYDGLVDTCGRWAKILCPIHDENHPSATYNTDYQAVNCFGCGWSGDSYTLIQEKEGLDFAGARQWAEETLGFSSTESTPGASRRRGPTRVSILDRAGTGTDRSDHTPVHARSRPRRRPRLPR